MHKPQEQVKEFHRDVANSPTSPAEPAFRRPKLRATLVAEEAIELICSLVGVSAAQSIVHSQMLDVAIKRVKGRQHEPNMERVIDGIVDLLVVTYGAAEEVGIDVEPYFDEVHRANMAKAGGPVRIDGKLLKPEGWTPPDIAGVMRREAEKLSSRRSDK